MIYVQSIYDDVCNALLEPAGLQLEILTVDDFLGIFAEVIQEWCQATGLVKKLFAKPVSASVAAVSIPDEAIDVQQVYCAEKYLGRNTALELDLLAQDWRAASGPPRSWHEDRLSPKTLELNPVPTLAGNVVAVGGGGGFYGTISDLSGSDWSAIGSGSFYGVVSVVSGPDTWEAPHAVFGTISDLQSSIGNALLVAAVKPPQKAYELASLVEHVPDSFSQYLKYGVLAKIFGVDGELRDELRQRYCSARFSEGVNLAKAISEEVLESEG